MTNIQYIIREGDRSFTPCPFGMTHGTISFKDNWLIPAVIKSLRRRKKINCLCWFVGLSIVCPFREIRTKTKEAVFNHVFNPTK